MNSSPTPTPAEDENLWPLGISPRLGKPIPAMMYALTLHRDQYGPPAQAVRFEQVPAPRLQTADASRVLVAVLATGPNFNTNFAALGLPVPVFGRGDSATVHIPGSDALGIVVDAGAAVTSVKVGGAVILDSWTGNNIRGYETHDGFNAQFVLVDEERAIPVPAPLNAFSPERLAAMLLTYGTAYRAVVDRLAVAPGDSLLVMGGGKGTSFAGAQIGKALGARVILVGSNRPLVESLIQRGIADAFVDRSKIPAHVFGTIPADEEYDSWLQRTEPFRQAVYEANDGRAVDKIFEHTGGRNFPLLASVLADDGVLAFFGATGQGLKGEYQETFYYDRRRLVMDARWVWMRQKLVIFRRNSPSQIFSEIGLLPGRRGLIWGADSYALEFAQAALERRAQLAVIVSQSQDQEGIAALKQMGITDSQLIDRDQLQLDPEMPDPMTDEGTPNPDYQSDYMMKARALGRAIWRVFGPRISPDFIVERADQSTLHFSTFVLRDHDEADEMPSGYIVVRGSSDLAILGSHMYRASQAGEVVRLLAEKRIVMDQEDLDIVDLEGLPGIQQDMLDGSMTKPKGVALVQADKAGRQIADYEADYLGEILRSADPADDRFIDIRLAGKIAIVTLTRPDALNALSEELVSQFAAMVKEVDASGTIEGQEVRALIIRGAGRSFVAGADIEVFIGKSTEAIEQLAVDNMAVFTGLENLTIPVVSLVDGFALGGGNELAISTHYRIVTENAQLGQPEVKLGIMPGYGGMQRLPRLIGPRLAAEMAVNGESVDGEGAVSIGLADEFHPSCTALARAYQVAEEIISGQRDVSRPDWNAMADRQAAELQAILASDEVQGLLQSPAAPVEHAGDLQAARQYAARIALEAMQFGYKNGFTPGLENDARLFGVVVTAPSGQEWCRRFLAKDPLQSSFLTLLSPAS
ncbi:MAG: enoyl-CoA hydratase-related protein [Pseudomonadales bacterium]|nr:enoyl-CoA hydratase-related protein [Pseudomonadales bacterium]MDP7360225.1 enoyl-CoA hydratase-related protein [Pseudomonadales bacterium]MDP7596731.1 enoyl-CoA hydratase-related protein [Pseudomonadales bacterium]HJN50283.1 enoyl-CoA hydratase-related protein [Pseudomonadales bacterium]